MMIEINGLMNSNQIMADLKTHAKTCMTNETYGKCCDIILRTARGFMLSTIRVPSYSGALAVFLLWQNVTRMTLISPLTRLFHTNMPQGKGTEILDNAWKSVEATYQLEAKWNIGHAADLVVNGTFYFTAAGWMLAIQMAEA